MICPKCGAEISDGARFCENCGEKLIPVTTLDEAAEEAVEVPAEEAVGETIKEAVEVPAEETVGESAEESAEDSVEDSADAPLLPAPKKRRGGMIALAVLLCLLLVCGVLFALSYFNVVRIPGISSLTDRLRRGARAGETVITVGDAEVGETALRINYINAQNRMAQYAEYYTNMYGFNVVGYDPAVDPSKQTTQDEDGGEITWHESFLKSATRQAELVAYCVEKAGEEKLGLTDEDKENVESQLKLYADQAKEAGVDAEAYLLATYGVPLTLDDMRAFYEDLYLANRYFETKTQQLSDELDYEQAFDGAEDKNALLHVDFRFFALGKNAEDAETRAKDFYDTLKREEQFQALARRYAEEGNAELYAPDDSTLNRFISYETVSTRIDEELADWLFAPDRKEGDKTMITTDSAIFVVMLVRPAYRVDDPNVTVRHILFTFENAAEGVGEDDREEITAADGTKITGYGTYSAAVVAAAYEKAKAAYDEYLAGEKTEEAFAALAAKSEDPGSADKGGLYEDVARGQMVRPFDDWCFDPARKPGDTGLVETSYGWHVMYYVSHADLAAWQQEILDKESEGIFTKITDESVAAAKAVDPAYTAAADAYLKFIVDNLPAPETEEETSAENATAEATTAENATAAE